MASERVVCGLDIGTTKICALICRVSPDGEEKIIGIGTAPSEGLKRGVVVNLEKTIGSIERAVTSAEEMAKAEIGSVMPASLMTTSKASIRAVSSQSVVLTRFRNTMSARYRRRQGCAILLTAKSFTFCRRNLSSTIRGLKDPTGMWACGKPVTSLAPSLGAEHLQVDQACRL
jgi:hypothetical protein